MNSFPALPDAGRAEIARLHRQHISVDLAEGIAHLVDDQRKLAVGAIAEIDRQRIEGVAEQAGIAEQQDAPAGEVDAMLGRAALRIGAQRRAVALAMVGFVEAVEAARLTRTAATDGRPRPAGRDRSAAQDAIAEAMAHRLQPCMHDVAKIERGGVVRRSVRLVRHPTPRPPPVRAAPRARARRRRALRHRKARAQAILVETIAGPGAAEPGAAQSLDFARRFCASKARIELRMLEDVFAEGQLERLERRVEADEQRLAVVDALQTGSSSR